MRWRGENVFSSTCPARIAVSSSSSKENKGTFFRMSGLQAIVHLVESQLPQVITDEDGITGVIQTIVIQAGGETSTHSKESAERLSRSTCRKVQSRGALSGRQ